MLTDVEPLVTVWVLMVTECDIVISFFIDSEILKQHITAVGVS